LRSFQFSRGSQAAYPRHRRASTSESGRRAGAGRAARQLGIYPRLPYYSQMFQDAGFPEAKEGKLSDRMIDSLVIHGSAAHVKDRLRRLPDFGAAELLAMPIMPPGDGDALGRTFAALGDLAAS
jgi:hypothetical protein